MGKIKFYLLLGAFSSCLNAGNVVDVFGTDVKKSKDLIKSYGSKVGVIESQFIQEMKKISNGEKDESRIRLIITEKKKLMDEIQKHYDFSYLNFNTIIYPHEKDIHTTIEVVEQKDKNRLRFIPKVSKVLPNTKSKHDLVEKMVEYEDMSMNLLMNNQIEAKEDVCPVFHCLAGFNHPKLRNSSHYFAQHAQKEKELIIRTIKSDPVSRRRSAAVFLVGYFSDPNDIIALLTHYVTDPDEGVRNNAMRVIGLTMQKAKIHEINVLPFLDLLDSPNDTDRNKALLVLINAASTSKQLIIQQGKERFIPLLRLKQPNNHDMVYLLLKKISGRDFGGNNIDAWASWLDRMNKNSA